MEKRTCQVKGIEIVVERCETMKKVARTKGLEDRCKGCNHWGEATAPAPSGASVPAAQSAVAPGTCPRCQKLALAAIAVSSNFDALKDNDQPSVDALVDAIEAQRELLEIEGLGQ